MGRAPLESEGGKCALVAFTLHQLLRYALQMSRLQFNIAAL